MISLRRSVAVLGVAGLALSVIVPGTSLARHATDGVTTPTFATGHILVKYRAGLTATATGLLMGAFGAGSFTIRLFLPAITARASEWRTLGWARRRPRQHRYLSEEGSGVLPMQPTAVVPVMSEARSKSPKGTSILRAVGLDASNVVLTADDAARLRQAEGASVIVVIVQ